MNCDSQPRDRIQNTLAPDGIWELREQIRTLLSESMARLPKGEVSEEERRCPTTRAGLRLFMDGFFARHYF